MTKMEHYKKRLIHQHEKPSLLSSPYPTTEEEDESPSTSPISSSSSVHSNQNSIHEKKREEVIQSKVAKKKPVSRKQFRHQNLELFKLGTSIPTSLCKTKEPYNICAEKNLQMCCQSQQNGKKESPTSITEAIINSMEGSKKRDAILWRSMSLNNERTDKQKVSNIDNNNAREENNKNIGNGRHVLPAIVPEIPERRKNKVSPTSSGERNSKNGCEKIGETDKNNVIQKAEPVSINKRKYVTQRRKTVIGIENSNTVHENRENNESMSELHRQDTDTIVSLKRRNSSTEFDVSQNSPINLSVKRTAQNRPQPAYVNMNNPYNDPRLNSISKYQNHYGKQSTPRQMNGSDKNIPTTLPQIQKLTNYGTSAVTNNAYYQNIRGFNFPEIQQQIMRMENPNAPVLPPNRAALRQKFHHQHSVNAPMENNEEVIKTIIQLVKSSMDPNFSVEILLILNKWYIELRVYSAQPTISKSLKLSIAQTLNEIILYISDKLFGPPSSVNLMCYVEEMMQILLVQHKELLTNLLPLLRRNCNNHQWMCNFLKLLSHSPVTLSAETLMNSRNINELQMGAANIMGNKPPPPNQMFGLPLGEHGFNFPPHLAQRLYLPPEQYFVNNAKNVRPPPPYNGFHFKDNALTNPLNEQHLANMNLHHVNGLVGVQNKYLDVQRGNPQHQGWYPTTPQNHPRPDHYNVPPPSKHVRPNRLHLADNRCVPPKYGPKSNPCQSNVGKYPTNDRTNIVPNPTSITSANLVASNNDVPDNTSEPSPIITHSNINRKSKDAIHINSENALQDQRGPNREVNRRDSETSTSSSTLSELYTAPDVEELLHTNVIFNKTLTTTVDKYESVPEILENNTTVTDNVTTESSESNNVEAGHNNEKTVNDTATNIEQQVVGTSSESISRSIPSTVIIQDNSMEITRGNSNRNLAHVEVIVDKRRNNSNEIIVERIRYVENCDDSTPSSTLTVTNNNLTDKLDLNLKVVQCKVESSDNDQSSEIAATTGSEKCSDLYTFLETQKKEEKMDEKDIIPIEDDEEVSVEDGIEMPKPKEPLPKLVKLPTPKRKESDLGKEQQEKKLKKDIVLSESHNSEVVVIDDEKDEISDDMKTSDVGKDSDCNQNYITTDDQIVTHPTTSTAVCRDSPHLKTSSNTLSSIPKTVVARQVENNIIEISDSPIREKQSVPSTAPKPIIEDISSDEESFKPFRLYNTYDSKVPGDPRKILETCDVSHCTLIEGNAKLIEIAASHQRQEKSRVYTKPVTPQHFRRCSVESENATSHLQSTHQPVNNSKAIGCLANSAQFKENGTSLTCHFKLRNTSELEYSSSTSLEEGFSATSHFVEESRYPRTPPINAPNIRFASNSKSANGAIPISPVVPVQQVVPNPPTVSISPVISDNSKVNWNNWITDEQRKGFFNFTRSLSTDSGSLNGRQSIETTSSTGDQCANFSADNNYFEIKIDSKAYTIKKSLYERIPKGKLCYIRETNTFIRYFDDKQMELFIHNLNINEGTHVASDLLKQIKGRTDGSSDTDVFLGNYEASSKSEIIALPKDVRFTTEDYLADPESYVEEVEKVERFVPKDFYGFYKFVTGYQIVNHHPPISFQTFLTMHNTSGIRGLFKNYINTLIEGRNIL